MKRKILLMYIMLGVLFSACTSKQHLPIRIINTNTIEKLVTDTIIVTIKLPAEVDSIVVTTGISRVETSLAYSIAYMDSTGLHHSIANKDTVLIKDTAYQYIERTKEMFMQDTKIEKVKTVPWWCYMMIALSGGLLALLLVKLFR